MGSSWPPLNRRPSGLRLVRTADLEFHAVDVTEEQRKLPAERLDLTHLLGSGNSQSLFNVLEREQIDHETRSGRRPRGVRSAGVRR